MNKYSHVEMRVHSWEQVSPFYENLLEALGFTRTFHSEQWKVFAVEGDLPSVSYFGITVDPDHKPNANMVVFWAADHAEVDRIAEVVKTNGGTVSDGPRLFPISSTYYAFYFQDPCGNKFQIVHRLN